VFVAKATYDELAALVAAQALKIQELEAAKIRPDEDTDLGAEREILKNAAVLAEASRRATATLYSDKGSVLELLQEVSAQRIAKLVR